MTEPVTGRPRPRTPQELLGVDELLDEVRLRPGLWVRGGSLRHLDSLLSGYAIALQVHGIDERCDIGNDGPFAAWLWTRLGREFPSQLGWAVEIERAADAAGTPAVELFFSLLDEYRAAQ